MAMNPMQRKMRNSFLFGFLIAIIIGAIIIGLLFMNIKRLQEDIEKEKQAKRIETTPVYSLSAGVKQNQKLAGDENGEDTVLETVNVPTNLVPENALTDSNLEDYMNDDGLLEIVAKIDMEQGTILTTDMVEKNKEAGTFRLFEFSMITLPSKLETGDYVDVRLGLATGQDYVVLSKIKVEEANASTVWFKLSESQALVLGEAVLESYIADGCKLYATQYVNAAQSGLQTTYIPKDDVKYLINANDLTEYGKDIINKEDGLNVRAWIQSALDKYEEDEQIDKVEEGFQTEKGRIQAAREALLGEMGY